MTLQQLRYVCEIVERGLSVSRAAAALHTSQPSISRQVQKLEAELGVAIFSRSKRRILGLTGSGEDVLATARKVLRDTESLRHVGNNDFDKDSGPLVVATSHTHARYVLPSVVKKFTEKYPRIRLTLRQGNPTQVAQWVNSAAADLFICSRSALHPPAVVLLPCYEQHKVVLVPRGHPLSRRNKLTIRALARYPIITYDSDFSTHSQVMSAFEKHNLAANVILSATDVDVMKTYVRCGLGVAIVAALAHDVKEDRALQVIPARHLFESNRIYVGIRRDARPRRYVLEFISLFAPALTPSHVQAALGK